MSTPFKIRLEDIQVMTDGAKQQKKRKGSCKNYLLNKPQVRKSENSVLKWIQMKMKLMRACSQVCPWFISRLTDLRKYEIRVNNYSKCLKVSASTDVP
jgi:hypothetical protein